MNHGTFAEHFLYRDAGCKALKSVIAKVWSQSETAGSKESQLR
jgi:hypothetical protein